MGREGGQRLAIFFLSLPLEMHSLTCTWLALPGAVIWIAILALPWQPWRIREVLDSRDPPQHDDLAELTALIPARNEASMLHITLPALLQQGERMQVVLVDDQSMDATADVARMILQERGRVISGSVLPAGWSGKLWALEQARATVTTSLILLLDADIELSPGVIAALRQKMRTDRLQFVSLMALLRTESFWERALMPAFVYFFKLLYPFRLANDAKHPAIAAAAGGCILVEAQVLERIGGFASLRDALIDDCTLAARVKAQGFATWIGLTGSARSVRRYDTLAPVWNMVARSAFTQLRHSWLLLVAVTAIFVVAFWLPAICLFSAPRWPAVLALIAMMASYVPILRFYRLSVVWAAALPIIATLFLAMSWSSAWRWRFGEGPAWKGRQYAIAPGDARNRRN
jgi:hopene-associated glycosyltransferase HpnB